MKIFTKRSVAALVAGSALIGSLAMAGTAFASEQERGNFGFHGQGSKGRGAMMIGKKVGHENASSTPTFVGNGQPIIGGKVTAVGGTTITVANSSVTYTVNASTATIIKPGTASSTIANVIVGDTVVVQGAVSGTSVTATSVLDQGTRVAMPVNSNKEENGSRGFFNAIGGFFAHMFGF